MCGPADVAVKLMAFLAGAQAAFRSLHTKNLEHKKSIQVGPIFLRTRFLEVPETPQSTSSFRDKK
jgi:hypothetical protein